MLKGKLYYKNKNIKYKVVIEENEGDLHIIIKTKLGKISFITNELILDKLINRDSTFGNKLNIKEYSVRRKEFFAKWNNMSSEGIKIIVDEFIKSEIDKDIKDFNENWKTSKFVGDFNNRGSYYEPIPKCPKIPMPECKSIRESLAKSLSKALVDLSEGKLNIKQAEVLSEKVIGDLDLNNNALMHKGITWYAKEILSSIEIKDIENKY